MKLKFISRWAAFLVVSCLCISVDSALACDTCAIQIANSAGRTSLGRWSLGSKLVYKHYEGVSDTFADVSPVFSSTQRLESSTLQLFAQYRLYEPVWIQANVPFIYRDYRRLENGHMENGDESGIGDSSLLLGYEPLDYSSDSLQARITLYGGIKLPTGDDERLAEESSEDEEIESHVLHSTPDGNLVSGSDLALGSGSFDFPLGMQLKLQSNKLFFDTNIQYVVRTEGGYAFQYGNSLYFDAGPGVFFFADEFSSFSIRAVVSADFKAHDSLHGKEIERSDQNQVFVGPEIRVSFRDAFRAAFAYEHAIEADSENDGVQPTRRLSLTLSYRY